MQTRSAPSQEITPLVHFRAAAGLPELVTTTVDLADVPAPLRGLLGQEDGMTAALERHWGEPMGLRVLACLRNGGHLLREVVLVGERRGLPTEVGFIDIRLDALPAALVPAVVDGRRPFGALLAQAGVRFRSRPQRFFTLAADAGLAERLSVPVGSPLYGRETRLTDDGGRLLAEVVEIVRAGPD